jgi:hypothetical protein
VSPPIVHRVVSLHGASLHMVFGLGRAMPALALRSAARWRLARAYVLSSSLDWGVVPESRGTTMFSELAGVSARLRASGVAWAKLSAAAPEITNGGFRRTGRRAQRCHGVIPAGSGVPAFAGVRLSRWPSLARPSQPQHKGV